MNILCNLLGHKLRRRIGWNRTQGANTHFDKKTGITYFRCFRCRKQLKSYTGYERDIRE